MQVKGKGETSGGEGVKGEEEGGACGGREGGGDGKERGQRERQCRGGSVCGVVTRCLSPPTLRAHHRLEEDFASFPPSHLPFSLFLSPRSDNTMVSILLMIVALLSILKV